MDDIGLERLNYPSSLRSPEPYDSLYTPTKTSSYQATERESEVDRDTTEPDRLSLLHKNWLRRDLYNINERSQNRVHWRHPTFMAVSFLAGLVLAIGHHIYYSWLHGRVVGSTERQQWSLRLVKMLLLIAHTLFKITYIKFLTSIGNAFAIGVSFLLKIAVGIAYIQYLWKTLRNNSLSLQSINDAFGIGSNIFSFFNWEYLSTVRIGAMLAIILW